MAAPQPPHTPVALFLHLSLVSLLALVLCPSFPALVLVSFPQMALLDSGHGSRVLGLADVGPIPAEVLTSATLIWHNRMRDTGGRACSRGHIPSPLL
ncbi:hypothetical protein B0T24DRAFT_638038 [Lasiosphaeria ovina]|uniref:Uncharacterized protein n=1 Tax=Lasiosphaeria ovina TaxID=92902 RepID=A0AAE0N0V7_9PEZI|nr:hypothetical protein B0T24DRAFT_638038 [Lasiosphaeria ovina]